jgi:hypothetical protein
VPRHPDHARRVDAVGGIDGGHWKELERAAIEQIKQDADAYCVVEQGKVVPVVVRSHSGREYLQTETGRFLPDDELKLADCPRSL